MGDFGRTAMNNDLYKYRKLAFDIKRNYPLVALSFDSKDDFFAKLSSPTKLFITKSKYGISVIFTYRRYENILEFGNGDFKHNEHNLLLESYISHDFKEIEETLNPYLKQIGFPQIIYRNVNRSREVTGDDEYSPIDIDCDNWGGDLVEVVNKYLLQIHLFNILKKNYNLINQDDIRAFGSDLFDVMKKTCMHVGFIENFNFRENKLFEDDISVFGDDLIEMIASRSVWTDYYIRKHFDEFIRDLYLEGDNKAFWYLS